MAKRWRRRRKGKDYSDRSERQYIQRAPHRFPALHDEPGVCRFCGESVPDNSKGEPRRWHNSYYKGERDCYEDYRLCTRPNLAKKAIALLRGACCQQCGRKGQGPKERGLTWLHLDHIHALADITDPSLNTWQRFGPQNLQLLCPECHERKTVAENVARAALRREAKAAAATLATNRHAGGPRRRADNPST